MMGTKESKEIVRAGVEAYFNHEFGNHRLTEDEKLGARSAIRDFMVRIGLYVEFVAQLEVHRVMNEMQETGQDKQEG